ncbi:MAG: sel1 repeat family protein [Rhodobacteraceae bacterium]|jgi:TPR repeat protein|nr:sel1 repeat family protein [Paracoccaceae bacterium]
MRARLLRPAVLALFLSPLAAAAEPLNFAFAPPEVVPQDICNAPPAEKAVDKTADEDYDPRRDLYLLYLRRDIRNLSAEDADRWFDFIMTLIEWQETLDPTFDKASADLARIALYVDAGRVDALRDSELIPGLRAAHDALTGGQKATLSQYYMNGIGVDPDVVYAQQLIRDAAYGGNVDALLTIARMEVQGTPMPDWDAPLDLTVTLAFGGLLGPMNEGICRRAERIGDAYLAGDIVARNPDIAYAWYRFSADLGGAEAAWKVAEGHLSRAVTHPDAATMLRYLNLAMQRGFRPNAEEASLLESSKEVPPEVRDRLLGPPEADHGVGVILRPSVGGMMQLEANPDAMEADESGPYLDYLRKVAEFDTAPGFVFTRLAVEVQVRKGRWAGEPEIVAYLEEGARRGDPEAMRLLASIQLRYRTDPARVSRAASLLSEAATRHGDAAAMNGLDGLYRCQIPDAPRLPEAELWAAAYRATGFDPLEITPGDLLVLDPFRDPEALAKIQTHALWGEVQGLSQMLERVQADPAMGDMARRIWVSRIEPSNKALELFAILEFGLATNPAERDRAVSLFRRVYLNNGVTTALDLSVALVEHYGRDPKVADEIVALLTQAGNRGEGGAIRLLARLVSDKRAAESLSIPPRSEAEVYAQFAQIIEDRGDFLALMFAIPHVNPGIARDYIERAVSLMVCGSKDIEELGDANALLQDPAQTLHWRMAGLVIEGGHSLSRLALTNRQMDLYGTGPMPGPADVLARTAAEGDLASRRSLYLLAADADRAGYDPKKAADMLVALLQSGNKADEDFAMENYRSAPAEVRAAVDDAVDLRPLLRRAAEAGNGQAQFDLAFLLRNTARGGADLTESVRWLTKSAESGNVAAMKALADALTQGLGATADKQAAIGWYDKAARGGDKTAAEMARLLRLAP